MDILIKNMEMPKNGDSTVIAIYYDGVWCNYTDNELKGKAVALPPHGELVDRDYIKANGLSLNNAPVILEATE